ncbi:hypothetical protein R3X27_18315 [Tropicimonas sp. TH_r6]|uniref:hypothetical protein n=1 Tax=Tropicimonas sp. TH_r6 TaxID=3082085 RepID=UPI002955C083|nr:hypothetical protein [Tropicimonas sp. TH_r6]MDV7144638.1 hypothetical protein [Tropicimonas sp. TH_r6]
MSQFGVASPARAGYHWRKPVSPIPEPLMAALARLLLILFALLSVVYVSLSLYSRSVRRDKLEAEWDELQEDDPEAVARAGLEDDNDSLFDRLRHRAGRNPDREEFVEAGLDEYDQSLRRKLILGVYVVPILLIGTIIYFTNYN